MTIGEKIYKLRSEKGVSQETMALDLNVSRQAVSKWETDQSIPDLDKIKLLSEYFNVTIDSLVKSSEIKKEIIVEKNKEYDANKIKRLTKIMFKTSIALAILYLVYYLLVVIFQKNLSIFKYSEWVAVFPTVDFIQKLITCSFTVVVSCITLKRMKKDNLSTLFELIAFLVYFVGITFFLEYLFGYISSNYINSLPQVDGVHTEIVYIKLVSELSRLYALMNVSTVLCFVSLIMVMIIRRFDNNKYTLPQERKEYKRIDAVMSFLNGLFLGIPGLLFQIIWLLDAKVDNVERFKKMRFWYIWGFASAIIINLIMILIQFL
ncbi:MAG: helix-turn-helix transcriptional regulator [Bacilli bacterium]|nr:helix-turn-helix transcriptional regulator [Bacilli bacterium]